MPHRLAGRRRDRGGATQHRERGLAAQPQGVSPAATAAPRAICGPPQPAAGVRVPLGWSADQAQRPPWRARRPRPGSARRPRPGSARPPGAGPAWSLRSWSGSVLAAGALLCWPAGGGEISPLLAQRSWAVTPAPAARWRPGCGPWPRWCWPPAGRAPSPPDGRRSWDGGRLAGQHRPGRGLGIDRVGRATPAAGLAVRPVDVPPHLALSGQEADQPSTVAASPSTPQASTSPDSGPSHQRPIAPGAWSPPGCWPRAARAGRGRRPPAGRRGGRPRP
jgi:hypothetical protein